MKAKRVRRIVRQQTVHHMREQSAFDQIFARNMQYLWNNIDCYIKYTANNYLYYNLHQYQQYEDFCFCLHSKWTLGNILASKATHLFYGCVKTALHKKEHVRLLKYRKTKMKRTIKLAN